MSQTEQLSVEEVTRLISERFAGSEGSRLSKHARMYDAIVASIDAGIFASGQKLPGERELCAATGISLGTVQKGLGQLVSDGRVERTHGRGTFVRTGQLPLTDLWHFRFRAPGGDKMLPVFARLVERAQVLGDAEVVRALGPDRSQYVRICRVINIDNRFKCWSEMYLPFSRFGSLLEVPQEDIESVNLKYLLATRFGAPTLATTQTVQLKAFSKDVALQLDVKQRSSGILLQIVASSRGGLPITFQRIHVPPTDCEMEVGAEAGAAVAAAAA